MSEPTQAFLPLGPRPEIDVSPLVHFSTFGDRIEFDVVVTISRDGVEQIHQRFVEQFIPAPPVELTSPYSYYDRNNTGEDYDAGQPMSMELSQRIYTAIQRTACLAWTELHEIAASVEQPAIMHYLNPDTEIEVTQMEVVDGPNPLSDALIAHVKYAIWYKNFWDDCPASRTCQVGVGLQRDGKLSLLIDDHNFNLAAQQLIMEAVEKSLTDEHRSILKTKMDEEVKNG